MRMRNLLMGLLIAASAQGAAGASHAKELMLVDIMLPISKGGADHTEPDVVAEIKVDGSLQKGPYDSVQTKTLEYIIAARGSRDKKLIGPLFSLTLEGHGNGGGDLSENWKHFSLTRDYLDPRATGIEGRRLSPIDLCNDRLNATKGSARTAFLKKGTTFYHHDAYEVTGHASADTRSNRRPQVEQSDTIRVPVRITCLPLDRPRPRKDGSTKGPPPREGKEMKPTISEVTLRVEPAQIVQDGKFLCPSQLRLYGTIETIREFAGKAIFMGDHYLSPVRDLDFPKKGSHTVIATYAISWHKMGDKAAAPNQQPAKQELSFRFNVSNKDGKVLESAERTIDISCRKIAANAPTAGGGMTVNPAN